MIIFTYIESVKLDEPKQEILKYQTHVKVASIHIRIPFISKS